MRLEVLFALEAFHDGPGEDEVGHLLEVISEAWVDGYAVASLGHAGYVLDAPLLPGYGWAESQGRVLTDQWRWRHPPQM